jgi:hypothetical protein
MYFRDLSPVTVRRKETCDQTAAPGSSVTVNQDRDPKGKYPDLGLEENSGLSSGRRKNLVF